MGWFDGTLKEQNKFIAMLIGQAAKSVEAVHYLGHTLERIDLDAIKAAHTHAEEASELRRVLIDELHKTFITPLDREDIHGLASGLDDVLDAVEAIASRIVLFKITGTTPQAQQLTRIVAECGVQIEQAVEHLKDFKGLMPFTIEINRLENEADGISRNAVADLFSGRHEVLDVLRWKEIYGRLESATDQCEDVANAIESIVLKAR